MHGRLIALLLLPTLMVFCAKPVDAQNMDKYIWEKHTVTNLPSTAVSDLSQELQTEVAKILQKPPLAPLRMNMADLEMEGYWYYLERGRIITTLAYAYPYLTPTQQSQVKNYVKTHLSSGAEAPWTSRTKANGEGAERNYHDYKLTQGRFPRDRTNISSVPVLHVIYGLWLYGERTGDWATIQPYWDQIKTFYNTNRTTNILYGQMSGHIAMARLARQFNDTTTQSTAVAHATSELTTGLSDTTIEARQRQTSYNYFYCDRCTGFFPGQPWMYLEASPEIHRYLKDNLSTQVNARADAFTSKFPHWWMMQQPSFTRWTGDEGQGITSEPLGMILPIERWIKNSPPQELRNYMKSAPTAIGDLYWIEGLVTTIEAHGQTCWTDLITNQQSCQPAPNVSSVPTVSPVSSACHKADLNQDRIVDLMDYTILIGNFFTSGSLNARSDINADGIVDLTDYSLLVNQFLSTCVE